MPLAFAHPCAHQGCKAIVRGQARCANHRSQTDYEQHRGSARERGYTSKWEKASKAFLAKHPICADPFAMHGKRLVIATLVDHIIPHRGDMTLFWDSTSNWQVLCRPCHSIKTKRGQ